MVGTKYLLALPLALFASAAIPGLTQAAQAPMLAALTTIESGQWELKSRGTAAEKQLICVSDARVLLQPRHSGATCSRFVITNDSRIATIQYSCPGMGSGRTMLRVETPRLVQIDSQGVAGLEPFAVQLEGRRIGDCSAVAGNFRR
jgi:hypothetical protein